MQGIDPNGIRWDDAPQPARAPAPRMPAPQQQPRRIYGAPEAPKPVEPPKPTEVWRTLSADEAVQMGLPAGGTYQVNGTGSVKTIQAAPKSKDGGSIPVSAADVAREKIGQYTSLERALNTFQDDFAGNTLTGGLENTTEAYLGIGTEGQSEWWADFKSTDNLIRNSLFGASLTEGEKAAYNATTISPGMTPEKVRANLQRRSEIVRGAIGREKEFYIANGYKPEAVEALFSGVGDKPNDPTAQLDEALKGGASAEQMNALAASLGVNLDQEKLLANIQYRDKGGTPGGFQPDPNSPDGSDPIASSMFGDVGKFMNAFGEISGEAATLGLADEFRGIGGALGAAFRGEDIAAGYERGSQAQQYRSAAAQEYMGPAGTLGIQLATGAAGGRGVSGIQAALPAARRIAATGAPVTRQAIQRGLTMRAGGAGATIGGVAGAAQGDTLQERGTNALLGGIAGGVVGAGGQAAGNALANRAAPVAGQGAAVQQAADNLGIDLIPAVTGGTTTRMVTSGAKQGFVSARPIDKAIGRMTGQGLAARESIADAAGQRLDPEDAGNVIRKAGEVFSDRTSKIGGKLYDRVEKFGGGQSFPLTGAVQKADEWLADVGRSVQGKDGTIYKEIEKLRNSMASGEFDVMSIPRTRDEFRALLQETNLRGTTLETAVKQILKEGEDDILRGLEQSGNTRAVGAFKTATEFWQKRVDTIDNFFSPILGKNAPKSGEQVVTALERLANPNTGNASQLVGIMKAMPPREAASVRATIINRMGRATAGSANDTDKATFSFDTFLTNWNNMSPRAKGAMFPPESRTALNDLVKISQAVKAAGSSANRSNTAGAVTVQGLFSAAGYWFLEPLTLGSGLLAQYGAGRLLASPKFARMLARAPRQSTPQARQAFSARLGGLAKAEPTLAREIGLYQQALAANDNNAVGALAAQEENQQPAQ